MPELAGFQESRSGFRARDFSPDSVIFTAESSNFSLFSSASASVERCSFASDVPDHDSVSSVVSRHLIDSAAVLKCKSLVNSKKHKSMCLVRKSWKVEIFDLKQHLAGHELSEVLSGPDPDPNKPELAHKNSISLSGKEKNKVQKVDSSEAETTEDENIAVGSARNSFSRALKECQDRRLRSGLLLNKFDRRRHTSLDLNNSVVMNSSSPRLGIMNKQSSTFRKTTSTFPSPGTPNYRQTNIGIQKGWNSERVPLHPNAKRRNLNTPLWHKGRTLPSKWEDAERWIISPVLGDGGALRTSLTQQTQRRPKSKSGPLGPPGLAYCQMFSPAGPMFDIGGLNEKLMGTSPFSAGVMGADGLSVGYGGPESSENFVRSTEACMARSISIHGCSEMLSQSLLPVHQGMKYEDGANNISRAVSRRDMATQMSPESSSTQSSPRRHSSPFSLTTSAVHSVVESRNILSNISEIRDLPVDEQVTVTRWSKKNKGKNFGRGNRNGDDWGNKAVNFYSAGWEASMETSKSISKIQREEAKITAWENLQKAKAEAAIRKLEIKLEKKRSSSMDKIMNKLRSAQKKAQGMRSSVLTNQIARPSSERALSFRRTRPISSLSGCFTCHAF